MLLHWLDALPTSPHTPPPVPKQNKLIHNIFSPNHTQQVSQEEMDLFDAMNLNIEAYKASLGVKGA